MTSGSDNSDDTTKPFHDDAQEQTVVVCGLGRFGLRVAELLRAEGVPVVALSGSHTRPDRVRRAENVGVRVVTGNFTLPEDRDLAQIGAARAVILAASDDTANLETALDIRRDAPHVRVVMRLDGDNADRLAPRLVRDFGLGAVLSPPLLAAPAFAHAALDEDPLSAQAAHGDDVPTGPAAAVYGRGRKALTWVRLRRDPATDALSFIAFFLFVIFTVAVVVFHNTLHLSWTNATYFTATIVTTTGFGDYNLRDAPNGVKLFGAGLMFTGVVLIALLSSYLTSFFTSGAAERLGAEGRAGRMRGHIVVCGVGGVGVEVAQELQARGFRRIVAVDQDPNRSRAGRGLPPGVPMIVGDATLSQTLLRAGLLRARALIAVTASDAINLEIALIAQTLLSDLGPGKTARAAPPVRLILRCFDPDLKRRIHAVSQSYVVLSSAEIAAPEFVRAAIKNKDEGAKKRMKDEG